VPADHVCRVIDAFVEMLVMSELGFERAQAAETGRPGYDPRDLLKLYLYGYLNQIRSSRRLEAECRRNVELMWLLGRLYPDHKSIAEFRRVHREAVTAAGAELVRFAKSCGLIRGEWIAIDGSKFRAVASIDTVRERLALQRYLDSLRRLTKKRKRILITLLYKQHSRSSSKIQSRKQASCWYVSKFYRRTTFRLPLTRSMR
jgi:transposase